MPPRRTVTFLIFLERLSRLLRDWTKVKATDNRRRPRATGDFGDPTESRERIEQT